MRYAMIRSKKVANVIKLDTAALPALEAAHQGAVFVQSDTAAMGDDYDAVAGTFSSVVAAEPAVIINKLAFMERFTDAELIAIYDAAKVSTAILVWIKKLEAATDVTLSSASTTTGVNALEAAGLIATGRASEILNA